MPDPKTESTVFPRGRDGLMGAGPVAPGPGVVPIVRNTAEEEARETGRNMEKTMEALTPQLAAEVASKTARNEARATVGEVLEEERQRLAKESEARKDRLRPFFSFMDSLRNLASAGASGEGPEGRTELVLKLYRVMENGGPKPSKVFQTQVAMSQDEALGLGDPDLEGRTMEWALQQGQFGRYEWRLMGWADGENILETSYVVTVEQPASYVPPMRPAVATESEPKADPMEQLKGTLGMLSIMRDALGLKGGGNGMDAAHIEIIKSAASSQARLEAANEHRRELRELEDRHRRELEEAEKKGYEHGKAEGEKALESERLRWDLSKARESPEGPSFAQEVAGLLGGPQAVQNLVGAVVGYMNRPKAAAPSHRPPAARPGAVPHPVAPPRQALPVSAPAELNPQPAAASTQEPTRAEWLAAMDDIEATLDVLQELHAKPGQDPEALEKVGQLIPALEGYRDRGMAEGSLAAWWSEWPQLEAQVIEPLLGSADTTQGETPMGINPQELKDLLIKRLDEGATDQAIVEELRATVPASVLEQYRGMLRFTTPGIIAGMLEIPAQHHVRIEKLMEEIKKAN